jgi:hypothetical protein
MTMLPAEASRFSNPPGPSSASGLEKVLRGVCFHHAHDGAACLWFVYGFQKREKTIHLACIGWIVLGAASVAGVVMHG